MPSEPPLWDCKEVFLKNRKQERGAGCDVVGGGGSSGGGSCSSSRWRDPFHGIRDVPRASPRRSLGGHYRLDGGYHQIYSEEPGGHGCTPSRSGDKFGTEEEIFRPPSGRYGGGSRSAGGSGKGGWEASLRSPNLDSGSDNTRQQHVTSVTAQRSVAVPISHASASPSSPIPVKACLGKSDGGVNDISATGQRCDRDHSLGTISWKSLKWARPSSLPLSKMADDAYLDISAPQLKDSPARSPLTSHSQRDDRAPIKKPRLGWGQGLAKYEKQKVEGSVDASGHNGSVQSGDNAKYAVCDLSPKVSFFPGSMSPATPTSAACNLSPAGRNDSFNIGLHSSQRNLSISLDLIDANSISTLALLLTDLMQPEDACSGDSSFSRYSTMHKLLLLKKDISKELEKTESEIDLFENKLKSINSVLLSNEFQKQTLYYNALTKIDSKQSFTKSFNALKLAPELFPANNCVIASSVAVDEQQIARSDLPEENTLDVKTNYVSSGTALCDNDRTACLERDHLSTCNSQCDNWPTNIKNSEPLTQPAMQFPDDIANKDSGHCIEIRTEKSYDSLVTFIMDSNREAAQRASEEFSQALPHDFVKLNTFELDLLQCNKNYMQVRRRLAINKRILKFKERVLSIKFRALHHLWREDLSLLTMRKHRPKPSKRTEGNSRSFHVTLQKHRSIRSRFALQAGSSLTLVPTTEMLNYTSKLLSDSQIRIYRNNLKMPAQIIDENDKRHSRFNSDNGLIENPSALEMERVVINPWMQDEKKVFLEMLATFGKDFKKISSFLSHKSTADCIEFYYKNHKSDSFSEVKRQLKWRKESQHRHSNTYLLTVGTRFNREANAASLDLLGAASMIAAENNCSKSNSRKYCGKLGPHDNRISRWNNDYIEKNKNEISENEREVAAADVLAGICCALSSDAMSSCVTSSVDPQEKLHFVANDCSRTPEVTYTIDEEDACSDDSSDELESADWTDEEKSLFIRGLNMYGKDFVKVAHFVRTRTRDQCMIFFSKARKCLALDLIQPGFGNGVALHSDTNGERSDTDDACAAEIDSAICSTQSCSKMDLDFTQSMLKTCSADNDAKQAATSEQCEIGRTNPEEVEGKYDSKGSTPNEDLYANEGGHLQLGKDQEEIGFSGLQRKESEPTFEAKELYVEIERKNKNITESHDDSEFMFQTNEEAAQKISYGSSTCELKKDADLTQFTRDLHSVTENIVHATIQESDDVVDSFFFGSKSLSDYNCSANIEQNNEESQSCILSSNFQQKASLELHYSSQKRAQIKVAQPEPVVSKQLNCMIPEPSCILFNKANKDSSVAIFNSQGGGKSEQEPAPVDLSHNLFNISFSNQIDSLHISKGFLNLSSFKNKELKIDSKLIKMPAKIFQPIASMISGSNNENCSGAAVLNFSPVVSLPSSSLEIKPEMHITEAKMGSQHQAAISQADHSADSENQSLRAGDLKLFGQFLTHPSSQKSSISQEGSIIPPSPKHNAIPATNSSSCWKDAAIYAPRPGRNAFLHSQGELPQRSYGFWDGNRIQTGYSSLPEPAKMLAKYQESLTGMPFNVVSESVANSNADYQKQASIRSVSSENFLETYPEQAKRNGLDLLSGFQQQGRIPRFGGSRGIIAGGAEISDPVAALQRHLFREKVNDP